MIEFKLQDAQNPLWQKLKPYLEERLENLRKMNDGDHNDLGTANLRGRIAEVKALLALDKEST